MPRNPFKRSVSVPTEVAAAAPLAPGEKVLAGTRTTDGAWLLGTRQALYVVPAGATERATELTAQMLAYSGRAHLQPRRVDLSKLADRALRSDRTAHRRCAAR